MQYNFAGFTKAPVTPAVEAGVGDHVHVWSLAEVAKLAG